MKYVKGPGGEGGIDTCTCVLPKNTFLHVNLLSTIDYTLYC